MPRGRTAPAVSLRDFYIVLLSVAVDIAALMLSRWILGWGFRRNERDVIARERRRLLGRLLQNILAVEIFEVARRGLDAELAATNEAISALIERRPVPRIVERPPPLDDAALAGALSHLERAVVLRVIQQRHDHIEGGKAGSWLTSFRNACLATKPRLIAPSLTVRGLERRLEQLRATAGLPRLRDLKVRRSHRDVGLARLRAWGLQVERSR